MLACVSKNDRARLLFAELRKLDPSIVDLGIVRASRIAKVRGALASLNWDRAQLRTDMDFSPIVARDMQRETERRIAANPGITHVLQWGAMYAPVRESNRLPYSIITDGPFDPGDPAYPVEWTPKRWREEYFARQRDIFTRAKFVFTLSHWARSKVLTLHHLDPTRVVRIGWGPMFEADGPNLTPDEPPYFVSIGNQWYRKGMDIVAEAGRLVHERHPEVQTIIAGEPAGLKLRPTPGVKLIPHQLSQGEVANLLRGARALIVASRFDASPHIIPEALQFGTPVLARRRYGVIDLISGAAIREMLFEGPASLALKMESFISSENHRRRCAAYSLYKGSANWTEAVQSIWISLLEDTAHSGGVPAPE